MFSGIRVFKPVLFAWAVGFHTEAIVKLPGMPAEASVPMLNRH
jgi:hypothetical protein